MGPQAKGIGRVIRLCTGLEVAPRNDGEFQSIRNTKTV